MRPESLDPELYVRHLLVCEDVNLANLEHATYPIRDTDWASQARSHGIQYILGARRENGFKYRTADVAVSYLDRMLVRKSHHDDGIYFSLILLPRACFELAARNNGENRWPIKVPNIPELTPIFHAHSHTTQSMEFWVSSWLALCMDPVTPFDFVHYFASMFNKNLPLIILQISEVILRAVTDKGLLMYRPSVIAAAATMITLLTLDSRLDRQALEPILLASSTSQYLKIEHIWRCYNDFMRHLGMVTPVPTPLQNGNWQAPSSSRPNGHAPGSR